MPEEKGKEVAVASKSPSELIISMMTKDMDLAKIKELLDIQKNWEANQARKSYHLAMANFKANPPDIEKDKKVKFTTDKGTTAYNHASLGNVTEKINAALSKCQLSAAWEMTQGAGSVTVTCRISHSLGHSEATSLTAPYDKSGSKNDIQALGSTISYLERYTLLALTGLATHEMDDDGKVATEAEIVYISDKQKSTIMDFLDGKKVDKEKFFAYVGAEDIDHVPVSLYAKALAAAKAARGG